MNILAELLRHSNIKSELQNAILLPRESECLFLSLGRKGDAAVTKHLGRCLQTSVIINIIFQALPQSCLQDKANEKATSRSLYVFCYFL